MWTIQIDRIFAVQKIQTIESRRSLFTTIDMANLLLLFVSRIG